MLVAALAAAAPASAPKIQPKPTARAYAPGEIVRFEVVTDDAVTRLGGSFFTAELTFVASTRARRARPLGWAGASSRWTPNPEARATR
jgi:hypothetical protein